MNDITAIDLPLDEIRRYCAAQPIARLADFGAAWRGELRPDTEVGLLVEYLPESGISYLDMAQQELDLGEIIGKPVDLRTKEEVSRYYRKQLVANAPLIYAQNSSR